MIDITAAKMYFKVHDPTMYRALTSAMSSSRPIVPPIKVNTSSYAFHLYSSIISQQISVKAAEAILARFIELVGDVHNTEHVLAHSIEDYRAIGLSRQKASYIRSIAEHIEEGSVHIDHLDERTNDEVIRELVLIKGVGAWTAEMFLLFTLARADVFSVGDLGLLNAARKLYTNPTMTKEELLQRSDKWSPHRSAAALTLWHSLDNKPMT